MFVPVSELKLNMAHHEESHDDHGHDNTEGSRQYYPKGWYLPLVGLFIVAFGFAYGAGSLLGISGTDKWGHKEMCHMENCDGHCGMDHGDAGCCKEGEGAECKDEHNAEGHESAAAPHTNDSTAVAAAPADTMKHDSVKPAEAGHEGHDHNH